MMRVSRVTPSSTPKKLMVESSMSAPLKFRFEEGFVDHDTPTAVEGVLGEVPPPTVEFDLCGFGEVLIGHEDPRPNANAVVLLAPAPIRIVEGTEEPDARRALDALYSLEFREKPIENLFAISGYGIDLDREFDAHAIGLRDVEAEWRLVSRHLLPDEAEDAEEDEEGEENLAREEEALLAVVPEELEDVREHGLRL